MRRNSGNTASLSEATETLTPQRRSRSCAMIVGMAIPALLGFFLGFTFGVGCALAVMYSIYMGGYRAGVRESLMQAPPDRLLQAQAIVRKEVEHSHKPKQT